MSGVNVFTTITVGPGAAAAMASRILAASSGITINPASANFTGSLAAVSTFSAIDFGGGIALGQGLLLTSGYGTPALTNTSSSYSQDNEVPGDTELSQVARAAYDSAGPSLDAAILSFTFDAASAGFIRFRLIFGSDEFPEFSNTSFVDVGAVFVNGVNYATFNGSPSTPLSITSQTLANFQSNSGGAFAIEYDGISSVLALTAPIVAGTNSIRIGISDTGDRIYDSGLFIGDIQLTASSGTGTQVQVTIPNPDGDNSFTSNLPDVPEAIDLGGGNDQGNSLGGNDVLIGGAGDDSLDGGNGDDDVQGGTGNDIILGGAGNDTLTGGTGLDGLTGGIGADIFSFILTPVFGNESSVATPDVITDYDFGQGDAVQIVTNGTAAADVYWFGATGAAQAALTVGTALPGFTFPAGYFARLGYFIAATGGGGWIVVDENSNGQVDTNDFAVRLTGSVTEATLNIGGGAVVTNFGGNGSETLFAGAKTFGLRGLMGDDTMEGNALAGTMIGGAGDDQYVVRSLATQIVELAGEGTDTVWALVGTAAAPFVMPANIEVGRLVGTATGLIGGGTNEQLVAHATLASTVKGQGGNDEIFGGAGANTLFGNEGDDTIRAGTGNETLIGGVGDDSYVIKVLGAVITEAVGQGIDTAWIAVDGYVLGENVEIARLAATGVVTLYGSNTAESLVANQAQASTLFGNGGDDTLWGSPLDDDLHGDDGNDIIRGQGGQDTMLGGLGDDQFVVLSNGVVITEFAGEGYDTAWYAVSGMTMADEVERANLSGAANSIAGNEQSNLIVGNPGLDNAFLTGGGGHDTIYGGVGADLFRGDAGNDVLYSGGGADIFVYQGTGFGYDQIAGFVQGAARIDFRGSGIGFANLFLNSAGGNTQVEVGGDAILLFGVSSLSIEDFLF